ncbi:MAG: flavin reductase family protein [Candidatus Thorarchaeota archaeon]|jgi:flavin reductase (DIM6/NTAB) family NADH-FMN oxidoreductase RutF
MKQKIKGNVVNPLPVVLVGTLVDNRPNYLVIGYIAPFNFGKHIFLSMFKKRYSNIGLHEQMTFSVNIPSETMLEQVKLCGSKSGRDYDKSQLFDTFYGELQTAPMIQECPLNMECKVVEILDYGLNEGIIGEVIGSYANKEILIHEKLDLRKAHSFVWATLGDFNYYQLGNRIEE